MAVTSYTVKRGDTLWDIAVRFASDISGSTTNAKIDTLVKINDIKNRNLIYVGQVLKLSGSGSSVPGSGSGPSSTPTDQTQPVLTVIALQASNTTSSKNRAVYAAWEFYREHTKSFQYRWLQYKNGFWSAGSEGETSGSTNIYRYSEYSADEGATKVRFQVLPVADTYKDGTTDVPYWTGAQWSVVKEYDFKNNPPLTPSSPTVSLDNLTLTISISNIVASELDATGVRFNIVKDNSASVHTSSVIPINTVSNHVSYQYTVDVGAKYTVRACCVSANGKESSWSDFSSEVNTKPSAPVQITDYRRVKRTDGSISAYLAWTAVSNAKSYKIEYVTVLTDFDTAPGNISSVTTDDARTSLEITGIESGHDYFFRVRAVNDAGISDPSPVVTIPIGSPPAAPTTWSSSTSAFVGETMDLNWTHNPTDGSRQSYAQLSLKIGSADWVTFVFSNTTNETTGEKTDTTTFTYGTAISYKGELHVSLNTSHAGLRNAKIQWKVRTAGVTDQFSDTDWSIERTIYIYEKPTLNLSMTSDLAGTGALITTLTSFPFYIRGAISVASHGIQRPVGYYLSIISNGAYETTDDTGRTVIINPGDSVYSKYFDTSDVLIVEMSAANIDLESGIEYTVSCTVDMSTGLSVRQTHDFTVNWTSVSYTINAEVAVNQNTLAALITPYCTDTDDNMVNDVTIAVYRREYDGSYFKIADGIPNNGTSITDPYPSLDYARYRLIAKDSKTGAISFYDMAGYPVGCSSIIIQWADEWQPFEVTDDTNVEPPAQTGSLLELPYDVDVTDSRHTEVSFVEYAGRTQKVSYYGTQLGETSTWNTNIPKEDKETIYALRRLSLWAGDVYVREPSGMGYWANVQVSFNVKHSDVIVPVTLAITRVEGAVTNA